MNIAEATRSRLVGAIGTMTPTDFSKDPGKHFTRNRKLPFQELLFLKVSSAKGSLPEELRHFHLSKEVSPEDAPSKSSYIQQCGKLSEDAFPTLLHKFNDACSPPALFQGHQLIACDGSGFAFHSDWDWDAYVRGEHGYFAVHFVALYDLISRKYIDAEIQAGRFKNEHEAICNLTDRQKSTNTKKILVTDRGFGSYNFYLHAEGIGAFYLVRITESRARSLLGKERFAELGEPFDVTATRHLVRHHRKSEYLHQDCLDDYRFISSSTQFDFLKHGKSGEIPLTVRIVRVKIKEGVYEYLATNLGRAEFPLLALKEIYRLRWGIETSFRDLKHTLGAEKFRSRQREFVIQEIWSRMILYNFCMEIVNQAVLKKQGCKYVYRINIAQALKTCHEFLRACRHVRKSMDVIGWILKAEPCPVREGRNFPRKKKHQGAQSFNYR